jgi:hypothetical protein
MLLAYQICNCLEIPDADLIGQLEWEAQTKNQRAINKRCRKSLIENCVLFNKTKRVECVCREGINPKDGSLTNLAQLQTFQQSINKTKFKN